jgi:hypothetical protein
MINVAIVESNLIDRAGRFVPRTISTRGSPRQRMESEDVATQAR